MGTVVMYEKRALLDPASLPEQTPENRIPVPYIHSGLAVMNDSCLIFIEARPPDHEDKTKRQNFLCKKDFWMSNATA